MANKDEIGNDVRVYISGNSIPVTSASYSEEAETAGVQFNTSLTQSIAITGMTYSGSFEHSGSNREVRDAIFGEQTSPKSSVVRKLDQMVIEDSEHTYTFKGVVFGSRSKDLPADDRTTVTYDFTAEELVVT